MTTTKNPPAHGTYGRYQQHLKDEGAPVTCESCKQALRDYQNGRRQNPSTRQAELRAQKARLRALRRLGRRYAAELQELINEELAKGTSG